MAENVLSCAQEPYPFEPGWAMAADAQGKENHGHSRENRDNSPPLLHGEALAAASQGGAGGASGGRGRSKHAVLVTNSPANLRCFAGAVWPRKRQITSTLTKAHIKSIIIGLVGFVVVLDAYAAFPKLYSDCL